MDGRTWRLGFAALRLRTCGRVTRVRAGFLVALRLPRRTLREGERLWLRLRTLRDNPVLRRVRILARELRDLAWLLRRAVDRRVVLRAEWSVDRRVIDRLDLPTERDLRTLLLPLLLDLDRLTPRDALRELERADERRAELRPLPRPAGPANDSVAGTPAKMITIAAKTLQRPNTLVLLLVAMTGPPSPE